MDKRSLKCVPIDEKNIHEIQQSLRNTLHTDLNNAGRKSLAKRSIENKELITYKTFKLLTSHINKPRTCKTLLHNIPQKFLTSMDSLPNIVKENMEDKGMKKIPSDVYDLARTEIEMHSLPLIKYLSTQCMEIEFDSPFETLEDEYKECLVTLFTEPSQELLQSKIDCSTTINILHNLWNQQDPLKWNTITLQPATQPCLNNSSENYLLDQQLPIDIDIDIDTETNPQTKADTKTKSTKKRSKAAKKRPKAAKSELPQTISPKQSTHASPATPSSEPSTSGQDKPIAEKTIEPLSSQSDKTPSKENAIPESKPNTAYPLPKAPLSKQTSSASSQGAIPKKETIQSSKSIKNFQSGMDIKSQQDLNTLMAESAKEIRKYFAKREATVKAFIADPNNQELFKKSRRAINGGFWPPGKLHDLLIESYTVSRQEFFLARKNILIKNNSFTSGHPPKDINNKKDYMSKHSRDLKDPRSSPIHYTIMDDVTPTEALDSFFKHFSIVDDGVIIALVILKTLRRFWGDEIYNMYFNDEKPFKLTSVISDNTNNPLNELILYDLHDGSQPIHYIEGNFYNFLNHLDYNFKDLNGEHPIIVAFCTDAETPLFCAPMLFEDANIHDINDKLVELFNKEPYNEKLMDEESWVTFRCTLYDHFGKKTFSNALKTISAKDITDIQSNREHIPSHRLSFADAKEKKEFYEKIIKHNVRKGMCKQMSKNKMDINTTEATPIVESPSLQPATSTTEKPKGRSK